MDGTKVVDLVLYCASKPSLADETKQLSGSIHDADPAHGLRSREKQITYNHRGRRMKPTASKHMFPVSTFQLVRPQHLDAVLQGSDPPLQPALHSRHALRRRVKSSGTLNAAETRTQTLSPMAFRRLVETRLTRWTATQKCEGAACQGRREEAADVRCGARPGSHARALGAWAHHHRAKVSSCILVLL